MKSFSFIALLFCAQLSVGQSIAQKLDSLFSNLYMAGSFNGNVLIAENGKAVYKRSFGLANEESKLPLNEHSIFELASVSKQFTAMAIAILNKQKKLSYNDPLEKIIPEFAHYTGITIDHLIHHTSGLPDYMDLFDSVWDEKKIATNKDIITLFQKHKPPVDFAPNAKYKYSNTGYAVLGTIIERVSKMSYEAFLSKFIFAPLKMQNTFVYTRRYKPREVKDYALGYVKEGKHKKLPDSVAQYKEYVYSLDGIKGDGTVNSTVNDLLIWDRSLYNNTLLDKSETQALFSPAVLDNGKPSNYGFGWMLENHAVIGRIVSHGGAWPGYATYIERETDKDKTIIILQNMQGGKMPIKDVRNILFDIKAPATVQLADSILSQYVGAYQLAPQFIITITKEGNQLKAQATGQGIIDIFPSSENKFFLKVVEAQVEFIKTDGVVNKLILYQGGQVIEGTRIK